MKVYVVEKTGRTVEGTVCTNDWITKDFFPVFLKTGEKVWALKESLNSTFSFAAFTRFLMAVSFSKGLTDTSLN